MRRLPMVLVVGSVLVTAFASADIVAYSGSLTTIGTQLYPGRGSNWYVAGNSLSWTVTRTETGTWRYEYAIDLSHSAYTGPSTGFAWFGVEVPAGLTPGDITNMCPNPSTEVTGIWTGGATIGMPETIRALEFFDPPADSLRANIIFESNRIPMWGDCYIASYGCENVLYNFGSLNQPDPTAGPANGSVNYHLLTPGSQIDPGVPEPTSLCLLGLATGAALLRRRRRLSVGRPAA